MGSKQLEELNLNYKDLRSFIESLEIKIHHLEAKASQLAGAYVIFESITYIQGILLSSAFQRKWWIPACLSAFVSVAFWSTFIITVNDCMRFRRQQDRTFMEQEMVYLKIYSIQTGRRQDDDGGAVAEKNLADSFEFVKCKRYAYVGVLYFALFSFTLLVWFALLPIP